MHISELLDIDFMPPRIGDYFDIETGCHCIEGRIVDVKENNSYIIDVSTDALSYLASLSALVEVTADYHGQKIKLNKPMSGDIEKFKVFVRNPATGKVNKVNFSKNVVRISKSSPMRRRKFRVRHNCANPGPRTKARYWSCRI